MVLHKINFPFYGIIIVFSIITGIIYIYHNIKKYNYNNDHTLLYFIMYIAFAFICGKMYTVLVYDEYNILKAGLSAYGGLVGVVIASIIFEKMLPSDGIITKYTILSLPLVYGLSKIGCFIAGCCSGIPYEGLFKIKYANLLNIWQFPIQIIESIIFISIFILCHNLKKNKNINYFVLIMVAFFKFLLDFLRYDHIDLLITKNQLFSIILLAITIIIYIVNSYKINKNKKRTQEVL